MDDFTKEVLSHYTYPAKFHEGSGYIFDANNQMIGEVRGWGMLEKFDHAEELQDALGRFMADAINEKWRTME